MIVLLIGMNISFFTGADIVENKMSDQLIMNGSILYVGGVGPGNYSTIQSAIADAVDGDTVFVYSGIYYENIIIEKSISLIGEDKNTTIIDGSNPVRGTIIISKDSVNVSGFTIQGCTSGVWASGVAVKKNHCNIYDNIVINNVVAGIFIIGDYNVIENNLIVSNEKGILVGAVSQYNIINSNDVIENEGYGLYLEGCKNNVFTNNNINYNIDTGIFIIHGYYNFESYNSSDNIIMNNTISSNENNGIELWTSFNNQICSNTISLNQNFGVAIRPFSSNNHVYHNNILYNNINAFVYHQDINFWDNGYPSGGNFWSDYNDTDGDSDGIGDIPYLISDGINQDNYPFMNQNGWNPNAELEIGEITGGLLKVKSEIRNIGDGEAYDVTWNISVKGGILGLINVTAGDTIKTLKPYQIEIGLANQIFGLGKIDITVTINAPELDSIKKTATAFVLGPLVLGINES